MTSFASSYMPTNGATVTRAGDTLSFPFTARPQALTIYLRFLERGQVARNSDGNLITVGTSNPRVYIIPASDGGDEYRITHHNGTTSVSSTGSTLTAPTPGDLVEIRGVLNADGSVQFHQTLNGGTEGSGSVSAAIALASAWGTQVVGLSNTLPLLAAAIAAGANSRATMRRLAGVA